MRIRVVARLMEGQPRKKDTIRDHTEQSMDHLFYYVDWYITLGYFGGTLAILNQKLQYSMQTIFFVPINYGDYLFYFFVAPNNVLMIYREIPCDSKDYLHPLQACCIASIAPVIDDVPK